LHAAGADVIILMFDITDQQSFNDLKSVWLKHIQESIYPCVISSDTRLVVVGNKVDLEAQRKVWGDEAGKFADEIGATCCIETSAKSGFNIKELLGQLIVH
jgi:GTPase SAR1 family protein